MFYERLKAICDIHNTTITAVVRAVAGSSGSIDGWKKGRAPSSDIVVRMALHLDTTTDYLLGLRNDYMRPSDDSLQLDSDEMHLIKELRQAEPSTKEAVLKMASAVLNTNTDNKEAVFLSSNDSISHQKSIRHSRSATIKKRVEGEAAAGNPITAVPEDDMFISVPEKYFDERYFIVRARGESMADTIPNGSYCIFVRDAYVENGCIVLVQIDGQTNQPDGAIKRVYFGHSKVELRSDNPDFKPMFYPAEDVRIAGVLVKVLSQSE